MTVNTEQAYQKYVGNGSTTMFSIPFGFLDDEIVVLKGGTWEAYEQGKDYSLMDCDVVFTTAPAEGVVIYIARKVVLKQLVDFIDGDSFPAENYEYSLDHITHALQELYMLMQQTLKSPLGTDPLEYFAEALSGGGSVDLSKIEEDISNLKKTTEDLTSSVDAAAEKITTVEEEVKVLKADRYTAGPITVYADEWTIRGNGTALYPYWNTVKLGPQEEYPITRHIVMFNDKEADSGNFSSNCNTVGYTEVGSGVLGTAVEIYAKEKPTEDFEIYVMGL